MVTHEAHQALAERVDAVERKVERRENEDLAGKFSLLRAYVASHHDEALKPGMLGILTDLEQRARPLSLALERAERIGRSRTQLLDEATR